MGKPQAIAILIFTVVRGEEGSKAEKVIGASSPDEKLQDTNDYYKDHYSFFPSDGYDVSSAENFIRYPTYSRVPKIIMPLPASLGISMYPGKSTLDPSPDSPITDEPNPETSPQSTLKSKLQNNKTKSTTYMNEIPKVQETSNDYENENEGWLTESYEFVPDLPDKQYTNFVGANQSKKNAKPLEYKMPLITKTDNAETNDPLTQFLNLKPNTPRDEVEKAFAKVDLHIIPEKMKTRFIAKLIELKYLIIANKPQTNAVNAQADINLERSSTTTETSIDTKTNEEKKSIEENLINLDTSPEFTKENLKKNNVTIEKEKSEKYSIRNGNELTVVESKHIMTAKKFRMKEKPEKKDVKPKETNKNNLKEKLPEIVPKKTQDNAKYKIEKEKIVENPQKDEINVYSNVYEDFNKRNFYKNVNGRLPQASPWEPHHAGPQVWNWKKNGLPPVMPRVLYNIRDNDSENGPISHGPYLPVFYPAKPKVYYGNEERMKLFKKNDDLLFKKKMLDNNNTGKKMKIVKTDYVPDIWFKKF